MTEDEQQLIRDREDIMAKLDDSIVSHVSITSEAQQERNTANEAARMQEL